MGWLKRAVATIVINYHYSPLNLIFVRHGFRRIGAGGGQTREVGSRKVGSPKVGAIKVGSPQGGFLKVDSFEVSSRKAGAIEVRYNGCIFFSPFIPIFHSGL
jgi:hypothetical protein